MRCGYCHAKVRIKDQICPVCRHLLANDIKLRRILRRVILVVLGCLLCLAVGILIGRPC